MASGGLSFQVGGRGMEWRLLNVPPEQLKGIAVKFEKWLLPLIWLALSEFNFYYAPTYEAF